jgi:1,4-alpha-glucan branching enzyme
MAQLRVRLEWLTGLRRPIFRNVRLMGSWDGDGRYSHQWRTAAMEEFTAPDGCSAWRADALLDDAQRGWTFHWGVVVDSPQQSNLWGIPTETADLNARTRHCSFALSDDGQVERYCRRLGANKLWRGGAEKPARYCPG